MAESPSHAFGQELGNILERLLEPVLQEFSDLHGLFLDKKGERVGVRKGRKLSWVDSFENSHDLDFVLETRGSAAVQGRPVAFIEAAWRSYTKHSKAKAQEIQGAVLPIAARYRLDRPFLGAVLAGAFTGPSIEQLSSNGFRVLYMPTESVQTAFSQSGIDILYTETTTDGWFAAKLQEIRNAGSAFEAAVIERMKARHRGEFAAFLKKLEERILVQVGRVTILPLFGSSQEFASLTKAIEHLTQTGHSWKATSEFQKIEVRLTYSNGDHIDADFGTAGACAEFLAKMGA